MSLKISLYAALWGTCVLSFILILKACMVFKYNMHIDNISLFWITSTTDLGYIIRYDKIHGKAKRYILGYISKTNWGTHLWLCGAVG